ITSEITNGKQSSQKRTSSESVVIWATSFASRKLIRVVMYTFYPRFSLAFVAFELLKGWFQSLTGETNPEVGSWKKRRKDRAKRRI
ncbi:unnamed protein product, partial [Linum tenue]